MHFLAALALTLPLAVPFDFENKQIFVKVAINGAAPAWFIVDSGASGCVIDTAVAKRLGLKTEGEGRSTGAGKGSVEITFTKDVTYRFAAASFEVPSSYVIDLSGQRTLQGRDVAGILGYDFFTHWVVDFDFEAGVMTLHDPAAFKPFSNVIPFTLVKKTPRIKVLITPAKNKWMTREVLVDSGSQDAVDDDVLAQSPDKVEVVGGVGLGQEFRTTLARAAFVQIGPFAMEKPIGVTGGVPLIGNEILRRFHIAFDYPHSRLIMTPNAHFRDAFDTDASGLDVRWTDDLTRFVVHDVARESPAAWSGFKAGDVIEQINGAPAASFTIERFQKLLTRAGLLHRLTVRRGGAEMVLSLPTGHRL